MKASAIGATLSLLLVCTVPAYAADKLVQMKTPDGKTVTVLKPKNIIERTYDGTRHQMVLHPKITRGGKWVAGGALYVAQILACHK